MQIKDVNAICAKSETKNRNATSAIANEVLWALTL